MNKQLSINLFLAKAMGLSGVYASPHNGHTQYQPSAYAGYAIFDPHTDKAQCMDVLLFAWRNDVVVDLEDMEPATHTDDQCMARLCEAIAIEFGWRFE